MTKSLFIQKYDTSLTQSLTSIILNQSNSITDFSNLKNSYNIWAILNNIHTILEQACKTCHKNKAAIPTVSEGFVNFCKEFKCSTHLILLWLCNELELGTYSTFVQDNAPLSILLKILSSGVISTQLVTIHFKTNLVYLHFSF